MIALSDLRATPEDLDAVEDALRAGELTAGARTAAFEAAFARHLGCRHAIAVASCTAALALAYRAAGVGPGDEVVVPAITFAATAAAVVHCGATPVFADVLGTHAASLDPEHVRSLLTPRTRAVVVVHFAGYAAPVAALRGLCEERGIALVEDAAHAPSATAPDPRQAGAERALGTWGLAGCFSFFSNKVLACGEGGLVATDDDAVAAAVRAWRFDPGHGANHRLDEPRAALLSSRLGRLAEETAERQRLTSAYRAAIAGIPGLSLPYDDTDVLQSSCYVMPVIVDDAATRDVLRVALRERHGVQTSVLYPALHELTAYRGHGASLPHSERWARSELTLPLHPHLRAHEQERVLEALWAEL